MLELEDKVLNPHSYLTPCPLFLLSQPLPNATVEEVSPKQRPHTLANTWQVEL